MTEYEEGHYQDPDITNPHQIKPMTDEQITLILEMKAESEHAPKLWAEVLRLKAEVEWLKLVVRS